MSYVLICAAQARCVQLTCCINCCIPCQVGNTYYGLGNTAAYPGAYTCGYANGCANACTYLVSCLASNNNITANTYPNTSTVEVLNTRWATCGTAYACWQSCMKKLELFPWCGCYHSAIPTFPGGTWCTPGTNPDTGTTYCGISVYCGNYLGGASCCWTVPAGVKLARFQIWGAGGASGMGCCCGGSPFGTTGAYASIIIPVNPGDMYCMCAGCACCIGMGWTTRTGVCRACASWVVGPGLSNFCAEGGEDMNMGCRYIRDMCTTYFSGAQGSGCYKFASPDCFAAGAGTCNGSTDYCFISSCSSCGWIWFSVNQSVKYYGCYTGPIRGTAAANSCLTWATQVAGMNGINGATCFDTNNYGVHIHPPTPGFWTAGCAGGCCYCFTGTGGGACCDVRLGPLCMPGAGGFASSLFGGTTYLYSASYNYCAGGQGKSGMVCLTYW